MVLAERNITDVVRNGRRSRGPSPNTNTTGGVASNANIVASGGGGAGVVNPTNPQSNEKASTIVPGAGTPESSDDDNSTKRNGKSKAKQSDYEEKIRVGRDYQAVCPPLVAEVERRPEQMNERALLVWSPTKEIPDLKLEEYISVAKEKYGYNGEQALGMLFWHKHDLERAVMDLANFTPFPDEWTIEDKVLFEQAFQFHGKSFHRIRQMLPDKSIASLVKYYYSWKKTRHRSSAMDRQEKTMKACVKDGSENGSEVGSNEESDNDDKIQKNRQLMEVLDKECDAINVDDIVSKPAIAISESSTAQPRTSARWTPDEIKVALLVLRDYGKNYPMIAKLVSTKTEAHVRAFYLNNRRRYNLDQIVKEYEAGKSEESGVEDHNEQIDDGSAAANSRSVNKPFTDDSNKGLNPDQELQAKKEKPELVTAEVQSDNSDTAVVTAIAIPAEVVNSNSSLVVVPTGNKITIMDESDTAPNSSTDMAISSTNTGVSASSSSLSSVNTPPAPILVDQKEPDSEELSALNHSSKGDADGAGGNAATGNANAKREISTMTSAEQPPVKKVALCTSVELIEK
ncbi:REST corepressor isoform X2 [Drosophila guanche]|uniref:Blast:REST corepressor n=1 Tax=Drosophila guanche TaxID=7266 RepID=A0A3B0KAQ5_DROGU|nr:REST corepressor isoform X2 [Drosophila guanche]SPP89802.1 blast:REST corepressor [Drosophila guanche]